MPAILVFVVFLVVLAFSVPIAIAMIAGSLAPIWITGVGGNVTQLVTNAFSGANSTPILAVPLFIFGGIIMAEGGISQKLFNFFAYFVGRFLVVYLAQLLLPACSMALFQVLVLQQQLQ